MGDEKGYRLAYHEMQQHLNDSIKRNNGAKTLKDCTHVLNDMIAFLHNKKHAE